MSKETHHEQFMGELALTHIHAEVLRFYRDYLRDLGDKLHVLDLGAGSGKVSSSLAEDQNIARIVAYDRTEAAMRALVSHPKIEKVVDGTHTELPFSDKAFHAVICRYTFHHLEQPSRAIQEMARVTRPSGLLLLSDPILPEHSAHVLNAIYRFREDNFQGYATYYELIHFLEENAFLPLMVRPYRLTYDSFEKYLSGVDSGFDKHNDALATTEAIELLKRRISRSWKLIDDKTRAEMGVSGTDSIKFQYYMVDVAARRNA
jgi:ubiquinone/menaquinone biosynthesis C-methylase UbiE